MPPPLGHPRIAIFTQQVDQKPELWGVKGVLPLGCLPLWGREGVTLPKILILMLIVISCPFSRTSLSAGASR
jgi:hypothetical protein